MLQRQPAEPIAADDPAEELPLEQKGRADRPPSRKFTLQEKLEIVREASAPGVRVTYVARRHGIAVNQLYYWRKVYGGFLPDDGDRSLTPEQRHIADLRMQVQKLETLLGQRTFEMVLLQERLAAATTGSNAKK